MKKLYFLLMLTISLDAQSRKSLGKNIVNTNKAATSIKFSPKPILKPAIKPSVKRQVAKPEQDEIYLNFKDAEFMNFVNYIAEQKKINILPDKSITSGDTISLDIRKPVSINQAWNILHTVAEMAGYSIIQNGDLYKIIKSSTKLKEPLPSYINVPIESLPDSDESIRYVAFLNNVKVSDIEGFANSMLINPIIKQEDLNGMVLIDKANNIKSAMNVIYELDKTGLQESVVVIKLKEANATEVRDLLKSLITESGASHPLAQFLKQQAKSTPSTYFSPNTRIIAEERTNSLILLGTKQSTDRIEKFIIDNIDKQLQGIETPLHIYELQYADASSVVEILQTVTAHPESVAGQQASKHGAVRSGVKYFKPMSFKADKTGNRIIVSTTDPQDWQLLRATIKNLDKPQPQVAIECLIVSVDTEDNKNFGGQTRNKRGALGKNVNFQSAPINQTVLNPNTGTPDSIIGNLISGVTGGLGKTLLTFGRDNNIWSIFEMLNREVNINVVSQPFLTVANKYKSSIEIGSTQRIDSGEVVTGGGATVTGREDATANLELNVTPQINIDGIINLDIIVKDDEFKATPENRDLRTFNTNISVADGQVIALSGFVKTRVTENVSKTPLLGDIPILGWFFKNKNKTISKQNILVFISPTIIKPREKPGHNLYTKLKLEEAKKAIDKAVLTGKTPDPIHDWFFDSEKESYTHKVDDYSEAKFQPSTVDIQNDPYYRTTERKTIMDKQ